MKRFLISMLIILSLVAALVSCGTVGGSAADSIPYIGENGNWWVGDTDTGVAAQGPKGEQGEQGPAGVDGANGANGEKGDKGVDGLTPFIGENGNWWIGDTDTGVAAQGPKGDDGRDGVDFTCCLVHEWETYILSYDECNPETGVITSGAELNVCIFCGYADIVQIAHNYITTIYEPDCVNPGFTRYECSCGMYYDDNITAPVGHDLPSFDAYNVDPVWVLDTNISGICDCEWERTYTSICPACGEDVHKVGMAAGHVYGEYKPAINDTDYSDCEWEPCYVAKCEVCGHADCIDTIYYTAPGHDWARWTIVTAPTVDAGGEIVRVCNRSGEIENKLLPALSEADYTYVDVAPTCTEDGTRTYTVVVDGESFAFDIAIPAHGHVLSEYCDYEVTELPTLDTAGKVVVTCYECGMELTYALPSLVNSRVYNVVAYGNCEEPIDIYTFLVTADAGNNGEIVITLGINGGYTHDDAPALEDCVQVEGEVFRYWVYLCTKCKNWIIVFKENK